MTIKPSSQPQYKSLFDKLSDWVQASVHQDVLDLIDVLEKGKDYLQAAEALTLEELKTLEGFLTRDIRAFGQRLADDADESFWWQSSKVKLWQLLGALSDKSQLGRLEMQDDVAHQGQYHTGEMVAIGTLVCKNCGCRYAVEYVEEVPPCIECGGTEFEHLSETQPA